MQIYGDVLCYETLQCDSGALCLDWREICDGIQQCLEGRDEENCDLLEMNRCENGMCIPDQFFLDGELDCLDWSDEIPLKKSEDCPRERVSVENVMIICVQQMSGPVLMENVFLIDCPFSRREILEVVRVGVTNILCVKLIFPSSSGRWSRCILVVSEP